MNNEKKKAPRKTKAPKKASTPHEACRCLACQGKIGELDMITIRILEQAFIESKIIVAHCVERATNEEVLVLGTRRADGFIPLVRLFKNKPMDEVIPPKGFLDPMLFQKRGQA